MELREFIKTALTDIVKAIDEAQTEIGNKATVMPYGTITGVNGKELGSKADFTNIDFDIAVSSTSEENSATKGKGGITVTGLVGFGVTKRSETANSAENVSRIRFSIQVILPHYEYRKR